jgi:Putative transposase/Transposase zinc-binding domain
MLSYTAPRATIQQLLLKQDAALSTSSNVHVHNVLQRIKMCRTASLGYHVYRCTNEQCGHIKYQYHSCRDRHCPNCGAIKKQEWIQARTQELLPVKYYHVVFTLPHELNQIVLANRRLLFKLLFQSSAQTLLRFANDNKYLGATPGIISVLHTWGQQLSFHPHIHSIVSGGGIGEDHTWKEAKRSVYRFLFPVKAMSMVYRAKFLMELKKMIDKAEVVLPEGTDAKQLFNLLFQKDWIVYVKAPFGGPQAVIEYLGRYTHKVAISNHRISSINDQDNTVTFGYKDYADGNTQKQMTLNASEFIRRFEQHILPRRFTKIRTYGYLSNRNRQERINHVLAKMKLPLHKGLVKIPIHLILIEKYGINPAECPVCKNESLQLVQIYSPWVRPGDG